MKAARPRVGLWLGLLLLFVPVFFPLLLLRPYSWLARIGWGAWLGLIVFVKVSGLAEPVIDLDAIEQELLRREQGVVSTAPLTEPTAQPEAGTPEADRSAAGTFIESDDAPPAAPPKLVDYLRELGGGVLGRRIADYEASGEDIRIAFQAVDWFLGDEDAVTLESIGVALSLLYGRDFRRVTLDFMLGARAVRVEVTRAQFEDFFGMNEAEIRASLASPEQARSPFRAQNLPPERRRAFFERFARYE